MCVQHQWSWRVCVPAQKLTSQAQQSQAISQHRSQIFHRDRFKHTRLSTCRLHQTSEVRLLLDCSAIKKLDTSVRQQLYVGIGNKIIYITTDLCNMFINTFVPSFHLIYPKTKQSTSLKNKDEERSPSLKYPTPWRLWLSLIFFIIIPVSSPGQSIWPQPCNLLGDLRPVIILCQPNLAHRIAEDEGGENHWSHPEIPEGRVG